MLGCHCGLHIYLSDLVSVTRNGTSATFYKLLEIERREMWRRGVAALMRGASDSQRAPSPDRLPTPHTVHW